MYFSIMLMRRLTIVLIFLAVLTLSCTGEVSEYVVNNLASDNLQGPVRKTVHLTWFISPGDGEKIFNSKEVRKYNKNGAMTKYITYKNRVFPEHMQVITYHSDGIVKKKVNRENAGFMIFQRTDWVDYVRNESILPVEAISVDARGFITESVQYQYDEMNMLESEQYFKVANYNDRFDPDFYKDKTIFYRYKNGLKTRRVETDSHLQVINSTEYTWNDNSQMTSMVVVDGNSNRVKLVSHSYDNDKRVESIYADYLKGREYTLYYSFENGMLSSRVKKLPGDILDSTTNYACDRYGNITKAEHYDKWGELYQVEEFKISYY
jgi:hypothetical protein